MLATAAHEVRSRILRRRCLQFRGYLRCRLPHSLPHYSLLTIQGQAFAEYAILIGVVTAAMLGMQLYAKRGLQAGVKVAADQLSPVANDASGEEAQLLALRYESRERRDRAVGAPGMVLVNESAARTQSDRAQLVERLAGGGQRRTTATGGRPDGDTAVTEGAVTARGTNVSAYSEVVVFSE